MASGAPSEADDPENARPASPFARANQPAAAEAQSSAQHAQPSSSAMCPMRALQEALGRRGPQGQAKRIVQERPLPELPPPEALPLQPEPSAPSTHKHVRMSTEVSMLLPPALSAQPSSLNPSESTAHAANLSTTPSGSPHPHQPHLSTSTTPGSAATTTRPTPSAAARAAALRPSLVKGGQRKHAAPGPPPPRKLSSVDRLGSSSTANQSMELPRGSESVSRNSSKRNLSLYLADDTPGEVQRDADGNRLSILQVIENDAGTNDEVKDPLKLKAQREEFLRQNRAVGAESVPELHKRLQQRREVVTTLTKWTDTVLRKRATEGGDDEHVDAEQLEEESRLSKMGGIGVGAALRAYWNATVQEEVELRFNTMRSAWEKEAASDMAELKDLRDKGKKLKKELDDTKQELAGLHIKYEVAQKQVVSAQRNVVAKQNAPSESDVKLSAGQQAVVEATVSQLKSDVNSLKGQLDAMASKSGFYQAETSKATEELNTSQAENAALLAKLRDMETQLASKKAEPEKPVQKAPDSGEGQGGKAPPPRAAPTTKVPVADPEGQKAKKDLDKLQNEHAKLQIAMRTKSSEVEKLAKELKELRIKPSSRAGASGAAAPTTAAAPRTSGGAPKSGSLNRALSGRQKSMSNKGRGAAQDAPQPSEEVTHSHTGHEGGSAGEEGGKGAAGRLTGRKSHSGRKSHPSHHPHHQQQHQEQDQEQEQEVQQQQRVSGEGGVAGLSGEGSGVEGGHESGGEFVVHRVSGGSGNISARRAVSGDGESAGPSVFQTMKSKRRSHDKSHHGAGTSSPQGRISHLEATIAKLQDQLDRSERARPSTPSKGLAKRHSGPLRSAKEEAELKVAKAQIQELNALVERLQKEIKALKESSSIQQQELTLDVELNKRMRLMQKLKKGANKVEGLLTGRSRDEDAEDEESHKDKLKQQIDVGTRELEALIQDLEAEFGEAEVAAQQTQQTARSRRRSSARGHRFTLDSQDLSSLLKSSSRKIQQLHSARGSVSGIPSEASVGMLPPLPLGMLPATARDDPSPTARHPGTSARAVSFSHEQGPAQEGETQDAAQRAHEGSTAWEGMEESSARPGVRFTPTQSQLPRGRSAGIGVSTVMGRQGPQVFGQRPASAQPATSSLYGSIEDATRWGGMFERLHASYLDPNGVWRVYTRADGPTEQVDSLQPLLEGVHRAAQRADAAARAAATTLDPTHTPASPGGTPLSHKERDRDRGRALEPTRRPRSAYPAPVSSQHPPLMHHQTAQQGLYSTSLYSTSPTLMQQNVHQGMHPATGQTTQLQGGYDLQAEPVHPVHPSQHHVLYQQQQQQQQLNAHAASRSASPRARSPSTPSAQQGWPHQEARTTGPPLLRHNLYQQQPDQPPGGYNVRLLTATPQKGIQLRTRPRSAHPSTHSAGHWELGPGEGEPQSPPPPQPFVLSERLGNNIGLSVPQHSWSLQQPGTPPPNSPAGGMLQMPGSSAPVYNGIEMMSRMELVRAVKEMEAFVKDVALRYNRMISDQHTSAKLRSELALEIAEAREHWVAENEYNLHLQVELERLHAILQRIAAEAALDKRDSEGNRNASLGSSPSSSVHAAQAAMNRANQVKELQEAHVAEAESAAERMRLPSPSAIRAKFRHGQAQLQSPRGSGVQVQPQQQQQQQQQKQKPGAEGAPTALPAASRGAGVEEQLAPWSQDD